MLEGGERLGHADALKVVADVEQGLLAVFRAARAGDVDFIDVEGGVAVGVDALLPGVGCGVRHESRHFIGGWIIDRTGDGARGLPSPGFMFLGVIV